jgi:hypothetical protein
MGPAGFETHSEIFFKFVAGSIKEQQPFDQWWMVFLDDRK